MITEILIPNVVDVLKKELIFACNAHSSLGQIVIEINHGDFEGHMGDILQQIQHIIDEHFPKRDEDLSVIIKNRDRQTQNAIKIWKPSTT